MLRSVYKFRIQLRRRQIKDDVQVRRFYLVQLIRCHTSRRTKQIVDRNGLQRIGLRREQRTIHALVNFVQETRAAALGWGFDDYFETGNTGLQDLFDRTAYPLRLHERVDSDSDSKLVGYFDVPRHDQTLTGTALHSLYSNAPGEWSI